MYYNQPNKTKKQINLRLILLTIPWPNKLLFCPQTLLIEQLCLGVLTWKWKKFRWIFGYLQFHNEVNAAATLVCFQQFYNISVVQPKKTIRTLECMFFDKYILSTYLFFKLRLSLSRKFIDWLIKKKWELIFKCFLKVLTLPF